MGYGIVRTAKLKSAGNVAVSLQHALRERETQNADKSKTKQNEILIGGNTVSEVNKLIVDSLPAKYRKDAVRCIEFLVTASPESMQKMNKSKQDEFFKMSLEHIKKKFGNDNVKFAVIHRDETTPHMSVYVVPLVNEKLNAKNFLGGREKLRKLQDDFHNDVFSKFQLERGVKNSKARHIEVGKFYKALNQKMERPKAPKVEKFTKVEQYLTRRAEYEEQQAKVSEYVDQMKKYNSLNEIKASAIESDEQLSKTIRRSLNDRFRLVESKEKEFKEKKDEFLSKVEKMRDKFHEIKENEAKLENELKKEKIKTKSLHHDLVNAINHIEHLEEKLNQYEKQKQKSHGPDLTM